MIPLKPIPSLPQLIDPQPIITEFKLSIPNRPELEPILHTYYTALYKSLINGTFDEVAINILDFFKIYETKFKRECALLYKKYAEGITTKISELGAVNGKCFNGRVYKIVNDLSIAEFNDLAELSIKYKEQITKDFISFVNDLYKLVGTANELYADIYEKDFKITADAHVAWLEYIINEYNAQVEEFRLNVEKNKANAEVFYEQLNNIKRQNAYLLSVLEREGLSAEALFYDIKRSFTLLEQEGIAQLFNYATNVNRLNFIKGSAQLKTMSSYIELVDAYTRLANAIVSVESEKLDIFAKINNINNMLVNVYANSIDISKEILNMQKEIASISHQTERNRIETYKVVVASVKEQLASQKELLTNATAAIVNNYTTQLSDLVKQMPILLSIVGQSEKARVEYDLATKINNDRINTFLRMASNIIDTYGTHSRYATDFEFEYNKMALSACARITAQFIRSYA